MVGKGKRLVNYLNRAVNFLKIIKSTTKNNLAVVNSLFKLHVNRIKNAYAHKNV